MHKRIVIFLTSMAVLFGLALTAVAQTNVLNLHGNQQSEVICEGRRLRVKRINDTQITVSCKPHKDEPIEQRVVGFTLINADTNQDIGPLNDGDTLNLATLPTRNLNIRGDTDPAAVGSVRFGINDVEDYHTENISPYALVGDNAGDYNSWTPDVGQYIFTITPYTEANGAGTVGTGLTIVVNIIDEGTDPTPTPVPTDDPTPTPDPTDDPTPTPVPTDDPTPTPDPTNTPVPPINPDDLSEIGIDLNTLNQIRTDVAAGVYDRACTPEEHDSQKWHLIVSSEHQCYYDHHHGDDPNYVNDIFGEPGTWFDQPGQSISYPWQTFKAQTATESNEEYIANGQMENDLKHEGYGWVVRRNQPCPQPFCTTDFRLQFHGVFGTMGAVVRYHSYSFEARVCEDSNDPSSCGIVRNGGWADFGRLFTVEDGVISCGHGVDENFIDLPADTLYKPIERPEARDEVRCHPTITTLPAYPARRPLAEWWSHSPSDRIRFRLRSYDPLGNINPVNPTQWDLFCDIDDTDCRYNQSIMSAFIAYVLPIPEFYGDTRLDSDRDGRTDFVGFGNRWGFPAPDCTAVGLDCVPVEYSDVVLYLYPDNNGVPKEARYLHHPCDRCTRVDFDLAPAGQKWITWYYRHAQ